MKKKIKGIIIQAQKKSQYLFTTLIDKAFPFISSLHNKKFINNTIQAISKTAYIISPLETLAFIKNFIEQKKQGAYMRFGDGDVYLVTGRNSRLFINNKELRKEMREAFSLSGVGIVKALMIHSVNYGFEKEMFVGNHLLQDATANHLLEPVFPFFVGFQIYSPIALHYAATYHIDVANDFLKSLKKQTILFIGNENTPHEIVLKVFGAVTHIKTPASNSYDKIDIIESEAVQILDNKTAGGVVVVAMGEAGRILMKRLYKRDYNDIFYFDFGSLLDGICGDETRTWLKSSNINYSRLLQGL